MKKSFQFSAISFLLAAGMLTGCGSDGTEGNNTTNTEENPAANEESGENVVDNDADGNIIEEEGVMNENEIDNEENL